MTTIRTTIRNKTKQSRTIYIMMMNHKKKGRLNSKRQNRERNDNNNKEALVKDKEGGLKTLEEHRSPHSSAIICGGKQSTTRRGSGLRSTFSFSISTCSSLRSTSFRFKIYIFFRQRFLQKESLLHFWPFRSFLA